MKRVFSAGSVVVVVLLGVAAAAATFACHPTEPKQASANESTEEGTEGSPSSGSSSSSGGSRAGGGGGDPMAGSSPSPGGKAPKTEKGEAVHVASLASVAEGLRWGMSHAEVTKMFTADNGVIWKDFDERLAKARVGPEMTAIEAEREVAKGAFAKSYLEFKDTPTGYDATGIRGEYTYRNKEALMVVKRQGKTRYFFFINDRLWKLYDEVALSDTGVLGQTYIDAVNTMVAKVGAQGRILAPNAEKGIHAATVDWKDGQSHLRVVDRSNEKLVAVILEDNATLANLAALRPNKAEDPTAIDPSIAAVTKGGLSDPNAAKSPTPAASSAAPAGKKPPKKK